jgi:hypothetical protein
VRNYCSQRPFLPHLFDSSDSSAAVYNPVAGFTVFFDFLTGLPARMENVSLIFCLFDGPTAKTKVRASDGGGSNHQHCKYCECGHRKSI